MPYTTLSTAALVLWRTLESYGCDSKALFEQAGLDAAKLADPNARYADADMFRLWKLAAETTRDPCLGLVAAQFYHPTSLHALGFGWMASSTLGEALERLVRYFRILSDKEELSLEESLEGVALMVSNPDPEHPTTEESSDALMAMIVRLCRLTHGAEINPLRVTLRRQTPSCSKAFSQVFRAPLEFSAPRDMLVFDREALGQPLPTANTELARANDQIVIDYLAKFDRDRITMRVRSLLLDQLATGPATQETIARKLNLSARSLQRKLQEEGTTYKQLVDDTRRELAAQYVKQSQLSINEITYMLGFSEPSNFTRAFKRWTGESPSEYRLAV